jgi:hypothetical protein
MDRPARLRTLDRIAGVMLALPSIVSLWFGLQSLLLGVVVFSPCTEFCVLFLLGGLLALLLTLATLGAAVSVWTGTRLGRLVGLALALTGTWWSASNVAQRLADGFGLATDEIRGVLLLGVVCLAVTVVLLVALRDWLALVMAEKR